LARSFAGGTDRIQDAAYGAGANLGCWAFWMKTTQTGSNIAVGSVWTNSRSGFGLVLGGGGNSGKMVAFGESGSGQVLALLSASSVNNGAWHHVAYNFNCASGAPNSLYIDGVLESTGNPTSAWPIAAFALRLLGGTPTFWSSYVGELAEWGEWQGQQLDGAQIAALARGFSPKQVAPSRLTFYSPMVRSARNIAGSAVAPVVTGTTITPHLRSIGGSP
jgi:hypothetical protein